MPTQASTSQQSPPKVDPVIDEVVSQGAHTSCTRPPSSGYA
jgi:hypothetical protein